MKKLSTVLIALSLSLLIIGALGCDKNTEPTFTATPATTQQAISNFLNDPHVNDALWEEWNIFDEYSASVSLSDYRQRYDYMCALRQRAIENIEELQSITPPASLTQFWTALAGTVPFDINDSKTWYGNGALGYYIHGAAFCEGKGWSDADYWVKKKSVEKNTQAWLLLKSTCRLYNIEMEWPLPRTP